MGLVTVLYPLGSVVVSNDSLAAMVGKTKREVEGRPFAQLVHEDDRKEFEVRGARTPNTSAR